jgi:hypothetical protein
MNWLERARREIRESTTTATANSADRNPMAVMAVPDPAICADFPACPHHLEDQTSRRAPREIQKSMQTSTANTADRNPTALLAVSDPVNFADIAARTDSGTLLELDRWSGKDWQAFFDERAGIAEFDGGLSRAQAEAQAFAHCVDEWLSRNPMRSPRGRCLGCGGVDHHEPLLPFGIEPTGHSWLHSRCWPSWMAGRRAEAASALRAMGIATPTELIGDSGHGDGVGGGAVVV